MKKTPFCGIVAFVCGVLALVGAVFGQHIAEAISPTPPAEEKIAETVVRVRDAVAAKVKDPKAKIARETSKRSLGGRVFEFSLGFAVLGIVGAGVAYSRREDDRIALTAGTIALVGLAWQATMIALAALVLCVIVVLVVAKLDLSPG